MLALLLALQQSVADSSPFRALALPAPTPVRTAAGPLGPDLSVTFDIAWHFPIPPYGAGRMGRVGSRFYELGQWYPRMAVYDDVHGWNTLPYLGAGEFYLEYGDFDVSLTVPAGFQIAATGMLANPTMIRTAQERARLAKAFENPGQVVSVITRPEAVANATRKVPGTRTDRKSVV